MIGFLGIHLIPLSQMTMMVNMGVRPLSGVYTMDFVNSRNGLRDNIEIVPIANQKEIY